MHCCVDMFSCMSTRALLPTPIHAPMHACKVYYGCAKFACVPAYYLDGKNNFSINVHCAVVMESITFSVASNGTRVFSVTCGNTND